MICIPARATRISIAAKSVVVLFRLARPSLAVDTACSSSLVAVHLACRSLAEGECRIAVAGGVNVILSDAVTAVFARAHFSPLMAAARRLTPRTNELRAGERAQGRGFETFANALADGDKVYAVIRGTAVNQDGRSNGLTAPNPQAQQQVIRAACQEASVDPSSFNISKLMAPALPWAIRRSESDRSCHRSGTPHGGSMPDRVGEDQHRSP